MWKRLANVFTRPLVVSPPLSAAARMATTAATPVTGSSVAMTPYSIAYITGILGPSPTILVRFPINHGIFIVPNRAVADSLSKDLVENKLGT
jgi:hypothetical protein